MAASVSWAAIKKQLSQLNQEQILSLLKDLYDASPSNKAFLQARTQGDEVSLADYEARIYTAFFGRSKYGPTNGSPSYARARLCSASLRKPAHRTRETT